MKLQYIIALVLLALCIPSEARVIRIDQGGNWGDSLVADVAGNGSVAVDIGFGINFGNGLFDSLSLHEDGFVSFADGGLITALGVDFESNPSATFVEDEGAVTYTQGIFDLAATFNPGDTPDAFRVQWIHQSNFQVMQILILDMGGGDFDLEINHGCDDRPQCDDVTLVGPGALAGFNLSGNVASLSGPFGLQDDFRFRFRDGELVANAVPAPSTLALLMISLVTVCWRRNGRNA